MAELVKDLVCGMEIEPETAAGKSEYQGTTYYFCATGCKTDFDADPEKYIGGGAAAATAGTGDEPAAAPAGGASEETSEKRWWEFWK